MATERKTILSTLNDNKQLVLPTTASVSGYDLNTGKLIYFNTGSNEWSVQETITAISGVFSYLTASSGLSVTGSSTFAAGHTFNFLGNAIFNGGVSGSLQTLANGTTPYLVGSGAVDVTTGSNGQVKVHVFEQSGNWTPTLSFSGVNTGHTYSSQVGRYYKIGRVVIANFAIGLSALGGDSGDIFLVNLPFTSEAAGDGTGDGVVPSYKNISNSNKVSGILMHIGSSTTKADMYHVTNPDTQSVTLTDVNLTNTTQLTGSIRYICST
jgi:hypothetical protein